MIYKKFRCEGCELPSILIFTINLLKLRSLLKGLGMGFEATPRTSSIPSIGQRPMDGMGISPKLIFIEI